MECEEPLRVAAGRVAAGLDAGADISEARTGLEPAYDGFANRCLTTWLPRPNWRPAWKPDHQGPGKVSRSGSGIKGITRA